MIGIVVAGAGAGVRGADGSADEAEVLKLDQRIADAVVRGDTAFVDSVTPPDFVMMHGDVAITDGRWIYLSHRTVHGPTFGPDRRSVSDK